MEVFYPEVSLLSYVFKCPSNRASRHTCIQTDFPFPRAFSAAASRSMLPLPVLPTSRTSAIVPRCSFAQLLINFSAFMNFGQFHSPWSVTCFQQQPVVCVLLTFVSLPSFCFPQSIYWTLQICHWSSIIKKGLGWRFAKLKREGRCSLTCQVEPSPLPSWGSDWGVSTWKIPRRFSLLFLLHLIKREL